MLNLQRRTCDGVKGFGSYRRCVPERGGSREQRGSEGNRDVWEIPHLRTPFERECLPGEQSLEHKAALAV